MNPLSRLIALALALSIITPAPAAPAAPAADPIRQAPRPLKPGDHGVGQLVADVAFTDLAGKPHRLSGLAKGNALVIAMTSTSCPLSKKYLPTLTALAKAYADKKVTFVLVNPIATDSVADMQAAAKALGPNVVYVHDKTAALAAALGALTTTDTLVLDSSRTIIYHGAIDDQYGLGYSLDAPRHRYLADALDAHAASRRPFRAATEAPGCTLEKPAPSKPTTITPITYHNRISRLMNQHCVECHRPGGVAPFALTTYDEVASHAGMIRKVVERGVMPPWFAATANLAAKQKTGEASNHATEWATDRSLAESEKADLLAWLNGGKPRGDDKDAVTPREYPDGWLIGKPDAVFEFARPVAVKATGTMPYQNIIVDTKLPQDQWVQAIEVQPGVREVVHHVLVFIADRDRGEANDDPRDRASEERQGFWAAYVPGNSTLIYPHGYAKMLPKGAKLRFQMHYTPTGKAVEDRTRIGVVFAKEPPQHEVRVHGIANPRIRIPPYADNHRETATIRLPFDIQVLAFMPHMHVRGKACKYDVIQANGSTRTLLDIPHYDFNWQLTYRYADPVTLSKGDTLQFTAWFDNSDKNPANPDPSKEVRWGPQTFNEMHLGYVEYVVPGASGGPGSKPGESQALMSRQRIGEAVLDRVTEALFARLDVDGDGSLTLAEAAKINDNARRPADPKTTEAIFKELDANGDGTLNKAEFAKLREVLRGRQ